MEHDLNLRMREFTLLSLACAYPDEGVAAIFDELRSTLDGHLGLGPLLARLDGGLESLQGDYLARFDGKDRVALYETEYGRMRGLSKGRDLADIQGFYHAFGFELEEGAEMPDHLAVELEFYGILLAKSALLRELGDEEGQQIVEDARRKFLAEHLGTFVRALAANPLVSGDWVFGPLLTRVAELVLEECRRLDVQPAPLDFFAGEDVDEAVRCGTCVPMP